MSEIETTEQRMRHLRDTCFKTKQVKNVHTAIAAKDTEIKRLRKALDAALAVRKVIFPPGCLVNADCAKDARILRQMWDDIEKALKGEPQET